MRIDVDSSRAQALCHSVRKRNALDATIGWSVGHHLATLHVCEVYKACKCVHVIRYVTSAKTSAKPLLQIYNPTVVQVVFGPDAVQTNILDFVALLENVQHTFKSDAFFAPYGEPFADNITVTYPDQQNEVFFTLPSGKESSADKVSNQRSFFQN